MVDGDISPCTHTTEQLRLREEVLPVRWDRCLPSVLAFASGEAADAFRAEHGGKVRGLQELKQQVAVNELLH